MVFIVSPLSENPQLASAQAKLARHLQRSLLAAGHRRGERNAGCHSLLLQEVQEQQARAGDHETGTVPCVWLR